MATTIRGELAAAGERERICDWLDAEVERLYLNRNWTSDIIAYAIKERADAIRNGAAKGTT